MTLDEARAFAAARQPSLQVARARLEAARVQARLPRAQWLPRVGGTVQLLVGTTNNTTTSYLGSPFVDVPRIGGTSVTSTGSWDPSPSTLAALGVRQEVFDFGRIAAGSALMDLLVEVERHRTDAQRLLVDLGVQEAYFAVHAARAVLEASEQAFQRARVHRDMAQAKVRSGLRPPIDLTRAEADLTHFDVGRIRARGGVEIARTAFAAAVGVREPQLDAAGDPPAPPPQPPLESALASGERRDPLLQAARTRLRAQEAATRAITAELLPNLSATATLSGRAGGAAPSGAGEPAAYGGWLPDVPNWDLGLALQWQLYDPVVVARRDVSRQLESVQGAEVDLVRQQESAAIQQAYVEVQLAQSALGALVGARTAAQANWAQADARFSAGLATTVEIADAEAVRTEAEIQLALGRFQLVRARAVLGRLIAEEP